MSQHARLRGKNRKRNVATVTGWAGLPAAGVYTCVALRGSLRRAPSRDTAALYQAVRGQKGGGPGSGVFIGFVSPLSADASVARLANGAEPAEQETCSARSSERRRPPPALWRKEGSPGIQWFQRQRRLCTAAAARLLRAVLRRTQPFAVFNVVG
ncbi:hypothetical protein MRX96_011621 [Rhipicephalus microplus]